MTFKRAWEKQHLFFKVEPAQIEAMVKRAFPKSFLKSFTIIEGGCANLNIKVTLSDERVYVLRIYVRDVDAAFREQKLATLVKPKVPIPDVYFIGDYDGLRFSIVEYMPGQSLRDVLLDHLPAHIDEIMHEVAKMLTTIRSYRFSESGFFDTELAIQKKLTQKEYVDFAKECLADPTLQAHIEEGVRQKITHFLDTLGFLYPTAQDTCLVHADFDPANILVTNTSGKWKISAILDWEFAFSGSSLCDLANMLRYAHKMPPIYEEAFLLGLKQNGYHLPENFRTSVHLLNLLSLLSCLTKCPADIRPNQCKDILSLITHILCSLETKG